ncbi:hypothetical protein IW261DRAFT_1632756 [Armillaria novae-zelandiae]|uniref:Uncharacterized protein n=1 Tax=Armillaria novae-zelandiae TaxID=153914 RepID=A0AA39TNG4_9AGAR|nr:hypothetical protein IW261DRAFT_1632756 [Armillaria novae-zelandiae]
MLIQLGIVDIFSIIYVALLQKLFLVSQFIFGIEPRMPSSKIISNRKMCRGKGRVVTVWPGERLHRIQWPSRKQIEIVQQNWNSHVCEYEMVWLAIRKALGEQGHGHGYIFHTRQGETEELGDNKNLQCLTRFGNLQILEIFEGSDRIELESYVVTKMWDDHNSAA